MSHANVKINFDSTDIRNLASWVTNYNDQYNFKYCYCGSDFGLLTAALIHDILDIPHSPINAIINGLDNVGKTYFMLWYYLCISLKWDKKFVLWCGENKVGAQKRDLVKMLAGRDLDLLNDKQINNYLASINKRFQWISIEKMYNHNLFKDPSKFVLCDAPLLADAKLITPI